MWDEQIDRIARDLTSRVAPGNFRTRVLRRIDAGPAQRPRRMVLAVSSLTAVAALGFLVAFLVSARKQPPQPIEFASAPSATAVVEPQSPRALSIRADAEPSRPTMQAAVAGQIRRDESARAIASPVGSDVFPLASIAVEALSVPALPAYEPVVTNPIATEPLGLDTIEIRPVDVRALDQE
jgi:hypothetical protein